MKKLLSVIATVVMMLAITSCGNAKVEYDIEGDIGFIKDIFSCVDIETFAEEHSDLITSYDDLEFEGTFAGIDGTYEIELYDEGDNALSEAGEIYIITFSWDYNQEVPLKDVAQAMSQYLGKPGYSDEEWGNYYWLATEMDEITKFSNAPFGNCFDVDIYGDDCCIDFGLSTT